MVCDEAHTALGDKTAAAIRSFSEPVYIGMTATDQLLQKHVGDVFPAEVADFPLAEAVRRGVVAPLRCSRVRPIASLRSVEIVGGDFDQSQLAAALDLDPLNLAAADLYKSRFGDTPGIVYAAGVEHAERIAASMKAIGLKAGAVSGKTPPRQLAETLAAYDRGEINVLVNAQLLAEGWNAPRATVCMHLAPTASRRVYQQRVGRIMRLHRRKEAGIVVDFAEPGAPHTERVITLHSLLGVDAYRPNGLVTPPPPRRRRWRRRPAKPIVKEGNWIVPVSDDPERRIAVIANQWRLVDASKLPLDEQRAWAVVAARAVSPADVQMLAERITGLQPEARELFFFTCAAENKHRRLRLQALGDLASQGPTPDHIRDGLPPGRGGARRGSRTAARAPGCCCWRWATSGSRRPTTGSSRGRGSWPAPPATTSTGTPAATSRTAAACLARWPRRPTSRPTPRRRPGWSAVATSSPLEAGAALLAVASPRRGTTAERLIERAPVVLSADSHRLAAALGSNIPAPAQRAKTHQAGQDQGEGARRHGLVQRRRGRLDAARRVGVRRKTAPWSSRSPPPGRRPAARRRRPGRRSRSSASPRSSCGRSPGTATAGSPRRREVRTAAADLAPLEVQVAKLVSEPSARPHGPRLGRGRRAWSCQLGREEAEVLLDDAARKVLGQLKSAGVRGRVRVEFELEDGEGKTVRDSRPGAVRKIATGEPVGASSERRDRRRRSRSRGRRRAGGWRRREQAGEAAAAEPAAPRS